MKKNAYPWIIWVENIRDQLLILSVYKPRRSLLTGRIKPWHIHQEGPIYIKPDSPADISFHTQALVEIGQEHIPPSIPFRTCLGLAEVKDVISREWNREQDTRATQTGASH